MDQLDNLTPDAQQALALAQTEARTMQHNYIGQEHMLLGLLMLDEAPMPEIRRQYGMSAEKVREAVTTLIGLGDRPIDADAAIGMTPRLQRAVQLGVDEAKAANQGAAGSGHLLCGILLEGTGVGAGILDSWGVTLQAVRQTIQPQPLVIRAAKDALSEFVDQDRGLKRYLLTLPADLFQEVQELADRQHTNVAELLRRFTRLGLLASRLQETPGASLVIREGDTEQRVLLL